MYLYFWYMRSIMTFYIKNCTFLYYFIQYFLKKSKQPCLLLRFQDSWYKGTWYRDAWYKDAWYKDKRSKQTLGPKDTWYIGQKVQRQMVQSNTWYNRQKFQCFVKPDKRSKRQKVLSDKMFKIYSVFFFGAVAFWGGGLLGWWPFGVVAFWGILLCWWPFGVVAF